MALITEHTESQISLWLETFFATLAAQVLGGTAGMNARRAFTTGQSISADDLAGSAATFNQAYIAGKVAGVLGTNTVRKLSYTQLRTAIEGSPAASLTASDTEILTLLDRNTSRVIARRFAAQEEAVQETLAIMNTRWTGAVQSGAAGPEAAVARRSMLSQLSEQLGFQLMTMGSDSKRFMQTELSNYFQRGQVQERAQKNPEEEVWKMPRDTAEVQCLRIHLNADGSPRRYLLKDVLGNSNIGLPPEQWKFVIGATHPFCYCILFEEELTKRTGPNKKLADRREEKMNLVQEIPTGPRSQAARRGRSVLPKGTKRAVRIGDKVVPVGPGGVRITAQRGRRVSIARSGANSTEVLYKTRTGAWTAQRQVLHEDILRQLEENITRAAGKPVMQLTGGGSASGKGSLLKQGQIKPTRNQVFVDSDEIKGMIPEYRAMLASGDSRAAAFVHAESSMLGDEALRRARAKGFNMTLDGTGDGSIEKLRGRIMPQKVAGYKVKADYVYISTDEAIRRSAIRAQQTGREVPETMIRSTHVKVSRVVPKALDEDLFDEFNLWDNSTKKVELIASKKAGQPLKVLKPKEWDDFLAKASEKLEGEVARVVAKPPIPKAAPKPTPRARPTTRARPVAVASDIPKEFAAISQKIERPLRAKPKVTQNTSDLDDLYKAAAESDPVLQRTVRDLAADLKGEAQFPPGLKGRDRAIEKAEAWLKGDFAGLTDLSRATLAFDRIDDVYGALAQLEKRGLKIVRLTDRFLRPTAEGYRDIITNIRMSNGHIAELQLHVKSIAAAKKVSHDLYKAQRTIVDAAEKANRLLTKAEILRVKALVTEQRAIYGRAFAEATAAAPKVVKLRAAAPKVVKPAVPKDVEKYLPRPGADAGRIAREQYQIGVESTARGWNELTGGKISLDDFFEQSMVGTGAELKGFKIAGFGKADVLALEKELPGLGKRIEFGYSARIKIAGSVAPAKMERVFFMGPNGLEVEHRLLEFGHAAQGTGLAKKILRNDLTVYKDMGVQAINLEAGLEVGGYAWARYGFTPTAKAWEGVKEGIAARLEVLGTKLSPTTRTILRDIVNSRDPRDIWKVADLRVPVEKYHYEKLHPRARPGPVPAGTEPLGSYLLREQTWKGSLNLGDSQAVSRLSNYVGV